MSRYAMSQKDFSKFDNDLNRAVKRIKDRSPEDWETVMAYLRSLALPIEIDPDREELVKYHYHTKTMAVKIVKRLSGLEEIGEQNGYR
jgi:hypothetical protein